MAPPPAPPPDPAPIVVSLSADPQVPGIEVTAVGAPRPVADGALVDITDMRDHAVVRFEKSVDAIPRRSWSATRADSRQAILRLVVMRLVVERGLNNFPVRIGPGS